MLKRVLILSLIVASTAGCVTSGNYCDLAQQLYPSRKDVLTRGTKEQIVEINEKYEKFCKGLIK